MLHFIYSAPADASAEEAAAHATGNGVASEVGGLHACTQSQFVLRLVLSVFFVDVLTAQFLVRLGNAHCLFFFTLVCQATGEAAGEDVDSDSDSDDDDDDVRVTIGDIKTGAPQYT